MDQLTTQASAQETINAERVAHAATFTQASATQSTAEIDATLWQLHTDTNQLWKDTSSLFLTHLLKYDQLLVDYLVDSGKTLQAK